MNEDKFIEAIKNHVSEIAIGASALRNQGSSGVIKIAREYFKEMNLTDFIKTNESDFLIVLDNHTEKLQNSFPTGAKNWGAARKAMNLFIRDSFYNQYLSKAYDLSKIEYYLEVPIDSYVAIGLRSFNDKLPKWKSIKSFTKEDNNKFQTFAREHAKSENIARVHLDILFWRNNNI